MAILNLNPSYGCRPGNPVLDQMDLQSKIPEPDREGRIATLNQKRIDLGPITLIFLQDIKNTKLPVLEIGTAYGIASLKALTQGATVCGII